MAVTVIGKAADEISEIPKIRRGSPIMEMTYSLDGKSAGVRLAVQGEQVFTSEGTYLGMLNDLRLPHVSESVFNQLKKMAKTWPKDWDIPKAAAVLHRCPWCKLVCDTGDNLISHLETVHGFVPAASVRAEKTTQKPKTHRAKKGRRRSPKQERADIDGTPIGMVEEPANDVLGNSD